MLAAEVVTAVYQVGIATVTEAWLRPSGLPKADERCCDTPGFFFRTPILDGLEICRAGWPPRCTMTSGGSLLFGGQFVLFRFGDDAHAFDSGAWRWRKWRKLPLLPPY